jgi:hypothetical protein
MADEVTPAEETLLFNEQERDELHTLALKLTSGVELDDNEKDRWNGLYTRFVAIKQANDAPVE